MQFALDVSGHSDEAKQIPTTIMGTAAYTINGLSGKKVVSDDVKTVMELSESAYTFKVTGFKNTLEAVSNSLAGVSLTLNVSDPATAKALQQVLGVNAPNYSSTNVTP